MRRFFFSARPEPDQPETQQRAFLIALYALTLTAVVAVTVNVVFGLSRGTPLSQAFQLLFVGFLLSAVTFFLVTRDLAPARFLTALGLFILAAFMIVDSGGTQGIGYLYFLASFPLLHVLLGLRWGVGLILLFLGGLIFHEIGGPAPGDSLLTDPELRPRLLLAFAVASVIGLCALVYQASLVRSLTRLAYRDAITGLDSRNRITEDLERAVQGPQAFSLLALKLHHFGLVSNHLGMAPGDKALKTTGERLRRCLPSGASAGRWTGTLFLIRLPETNLDRLEDLGRRLLAEVSQPVDLDGEHLILQPGVAVTRFPEDGQSVDRLVANLSTTLARGEDQPGQVLAFDEAAWKAEERRFRVAAALEQALPLGQFQVAYQPKIDLTNGRPHGAEALLRWTSPELGPISPAEFIPVAETLGLIHPITWFVIDQVLADLTAFPAGVSPQGPVAVNLSSQDLGRRDLPEKLMARFHRAGVSPAAAELEITEGVMMSQDPHVRHVLDHLKQAGFRLAIDDFGTGYSSLSYLHRLNADTLKIDQSFIRQLDASAAMPSIVDAIISMGLSLGLQIVAEGVETADQARYLKDRGCTLAQGWLYSKPMPYADYTRWLAGRTP